METIKNGIVKSIISFIFILGLFTTFVPPAITYAEDTPTSSINIGSESYDSLQEAINAVEDNETITLNADVNEDGSINVNNGKTFTLDLNGNVLNATKQIYLTNSSKLEVKDSQEDGKVISKADPIFRVEKGELTLTSGTYHSQGGKWAWGVLLVGSTNSADENYSVVNVEKDATITFETNGYGIATTPTSTGYNKFGMVANIDGTIIADGTQTGSSVYIHGAQQDLEGATRINISETAKLQGMIYAAGYGIWNITGGDISGLEALSIKAGEFNISEGSFVATGEYHNPVVANDNGSEDTGAVISMTSNDTYTGKIIMNISGGTFESQKGHAVYESISIKNEIPAATGTHVKELNISGGTFKGATDKEAVNVSAYNKAFMSGGTYNTQPNANYINEEYFAEQKGTDYKVIHYIDSTILNDQTIKQIVNGNSDSLTKGQILLVQALALLMDEKSEGSNPPNEEVLNILNNSIDKVVEYYLNKVKDKTDKIPSFETLQLVNENLVKDARDAYNDAIDNDIRDNVKNALATQETIIKKAEERIDKIKAFNKSATLSTKTYVYNGKAKQPTVKITGLVSGEDYKVTYKNNTKVGKATVTITGINYLENVVPKTKTLTYTIKPAKASVSKLTKGTKSFKVTIKSQKASGISGYQIAYSTKSKSGFKTTTSTSINKTIKNLSAKKAYYVKVRAYKTIDGKKVYGTYSTVKKVTTK